jgi:hypothetical protein
VKQEKKDTDINPATALIPSWEFQLANRFAKKIEKKAPPKEIEEAGTDLAVHINRRKTSGVAGE